MHERSILLRLVTTTLTDRYPDARPTGDRQVLLVEDVPIMLYGMFLRHRLAVPVVVLTVVGSPVYEHQCQHRI